MSFGPSFQGKEEIPDPELSTLPPPFLEGGGGWPFFLLLLPPTPRLGPGLTNQCVKFPFPP